MRIELVASCMTAPKHTLMVCERYADWALSKVPPHYFVNCYNRYEKRQSARYPSAAVCAAIFKISFNIWADVSPNYCISGDVC